MLDVTRNNKEVLITVAELLSTTLVNVELPMAELSDMLISIPLLVEE
jgi:hypothetical protein